MLCGIPLLGVIVILRDTIGLVRDVFFNTITYWMIPS